MKAFGEKGGLMYRLVPGPRYAVRELAYQGLVHGKVHSGRFPSGQEVVQLLSSFPGPERRRRMRRPLRVRRRHRGLLLLAAACRWEPWSGAAP